MPDMPRCSGVAVLESESASVEESMLTKGQNESGRTDVGNNDVGSTVGRSIGVAVVVVVVVVVVIVVAVGRAGEGAIGGNDIDETGAHSPASIERKAARLDGEDGALKP